MALLCSQRGLPAFSKHEGDLRRFARCQAAGNVALVLMTLAAKRPIPVRAEPVPELDAVQARVQYVIPAATKPFSYEYEPPPGVPRRSATFDERQHPDP